MSTVRAEPVVAATCWVESPLNCAPVVAGGDSLVAHPRVCRPRCGRCRRSPGRRVCSLGGAGFPNGRTAEWFRSCGGGARGRSGMMFAAVRISGTLGRGPSTAHRLHPRVARLLPVLRCRRPGDLRRQGKVAPVPPELVLPGSGRTALPDGPDGGPGRPRRVDGGQLRSRSPGARAQPDPALPTPLQRASEGRQELPVVGHLGGRSMATAGHCPRPQAQGGPVLRAIPQRRCHPGDPGPAVAVLPTSDLLRYQVQESRPVGATVSVVPHRPVLRAVCERDLPRRVRRDGGRFCDVPRRGHRSAGEGTDGRHAAGGQRPGVRTGVTAPGQALRHPGGRCRSADGVGPSRGSRRRGVVRR